MRVLITGTDGQVARAFAERAAVLDDVEIVCVGRPLLDLESPASLRTALQSVAPDLVVNAAAHTGVDRQEDEPELAFRINADGPAELARLTKAAGIPIVQISTDYVFDGRSSRPYDEADTTNPETVYGRSKLAGEKAVQAENEDHLIIRTAWVVSPYGTNFVKSILSAAQTRTHLSVVADQFGNPTEAHDLVDGLLAAIRWRMKSGTFPQGLYHLAGQGRASWYDLAKHVLSVSAASGGPFADVEPISSESWPSTALRPANSQLDCGAFARDFDYSAGEWKERTAELVTGLLNTRPSKIG